MMTSWLEKLNTRFKRNLCLSFIPLVLYNLPRYSSNNVVPAIYIYTHVPVAIAYTQQSRVISIYSQSIIIVYQINHRTFFIDDNATVTWVYCICRRVSARVLLSVQQQYKRHNSARLRPRRGQVLFIIIIKSVRLGHYPRGQSRSDDVCSSPYV